MFVSLSPEQLHALGEVSEFYRLPAMGPPRDDENRPVRVRFGLLADPQYADVDPDPSHVRYYRHSLEKLAQVIDELNQQPLDFVVTLGDLVDRQWSSYADILPLYRRLKHPHLTVMGNHDADTLSRHLASQRPALALPKHYFHFSFAGYCFIAIDGNDLSLYCNQANGDEQLRAQHMLGQLQAQGAIQAQPWNGGLGEAQLDWLAQTLQTAAQRHEQIIVFGHYPLAPEDRHNLWNHQAVVALLVKYRARAYFAGHQHAGGYQRIDGTDFITLKGLVDGARSTPFAVVELYGNTLTLHGYGTQHSLTLK
ncbi:metallophosphoesterase [Acerihabitans sp. TG2]|uniref:metallophosphoesterase n=1 Tax=Acerihabitans sp. TG2 TaxID=3096008 RepID=UPI002B22372B|nr:metallophosphoesterase [Acerihabitans sp. TG2]MEA9393438.1 metallophosphoesterase [Acerihabitans sp. TG2]